jgi:hypothetical protein
MVFSNGSDRIQFLLMLFGLIILSGAVLKYNVEGADSGTEGLENMQRQNFKLTPGEFPGTLDSLLLNPEFPTPGSVLNVSSVASSSAPVDAASASASASSQILSASDYPTKTSNSRYVQSPDNNTCMPMTMCNSFYGVRNEQAPPPPAPISLTDSRRRVNFYATEDNNVSAPLHVEN